MSKKKKSKKKYKGRVDTSTISGRVRALGFRSYAEYLASPHWRAVRKAYGESDLPQNCACGATRDALHHKTYARLGEELLTDLQPVCDDCHKRIHGKRKKKPRRPARKRNQRQRKRAKSRRKKSQERLTPAQRRRRDQLRVLAEVKEMAGRSGQQTETEGGRA